MTHIAGRIEDFDWDVAVDEGLAFSDGLDGLEGFRQDLSSLLGVVVEPARGEFIPELLDVCEVFRIGLGHDSRCALFDEFSPRPDDIPPAVREQHHLSLCNCAVWVAIDDEAGVVLFDGHTVDRSGNQPDVIAQLDSLAGIRFAGQGHDQQKSSECGDYVSHGLAPNTARISFGWLDRCSLMTL